jgi:hypothetical protein
MNITKEKVRDLIQTTSALLVALLATVVFGTVLTTTLFLP